jgi:transposase
MGRHFTEAFKRETVQLALTSGKSHAELGQDLGIRPDLLHKWKQWVKVRDAQLAGGAGSRPETPGRTAGNEDAVEGELRRLRRENAVLREEREILKKATAFFAKESR